MSHAKEILQSMSERFATSANVNQVFGEPITVGGKTVVPVAHVHYRLGGGWGGGEQGSGTVDHPLAAGAGGGGGLVTAAPVGALEITDTGVRVSRFPEDRTAVARGNGIFAASGDQCDRRNSAH